MTPDPMDREPSGAWGIPYFVRHRTAANLLMLVLMLVGAVAASRMRAQYFPDIVPTSISVSVAWPGAGAADVDRAIVSRIEPALLVLDGVVDVASEAREGAASISLEFETGTDLARAADAVTAALAGVSDLPRDAEAPQVRQDQWRDRVTDVVITGPVGVDQLARFADEFTARLYDAGVTRTSVLGLAAPDVDIEVPTISLMRHGLTMAEVADAIAQQVTTGPIGALDGDAARLRTGADLRTPLDLGAAVLRTLANGEKLLLSDIATLTARSADDSRAAFVGSNPAMTVRVDRNDTGDAIAIQDTVARVAADLTRTLPPGVTMDLTRSRADLIADRLALLLDNALAGLAMVVVLLFLFLNARTALWVAAGVPIAILAGLMLMYLGGLTLNMISLFAMIITVGIIVDDAIIVAEHTDYRVRQLGEPPELAAERGVLRLAGPIVASTLIIVIAFLGLMVIGGPFGALIAAIPFTVIAILMASLIEVFYILPNHLAHALRDLGARRWYDWPSIQVNRGLDWFNAHVTRPVARAVLVARYPVLALALFLLATQLAAFLRGDVAYRFFVAPEQAVVTGSFAMADGATRTDTLAMMRELQRAADATAKDFEKEYGRNPVRFALAEVGGNAGRGLAGAEGKEADLLGGISLELIDADLRPYSALAFAAAVEKAVVKHPLLEEISFRGQRFGPGSDSLAVDLFSTSTDDLVAATSALRGALGDYRVVSGVEDTLDDAGNDLIVNLTPMGQSLGLDAATLARTLRDHLNGIEVATYPVGQRSGTIRLQVPPGERAADVLETLRIRTAQGDYIPLADVVTVAARPGLASILRENGRQAVTVSGDLIEDRPTEAAAVEADLVATILPRIAADYGITWRMSGQSAQEDAFLADAGLAFLLCLAGIYLCLAWITAQWFRPLLVMSVIPFGIAGAVWGHTVWGLPLSLFSIVGLITMAGIITNDAIVLVSTVDEYAETRAIRPAIIDAVVNRLRPILLTSSTNIVGLAPMLYERSSQAEFLKSTVVTFVFGLSAGLLLILFVVPAILMIDADIRRALSALRKATLGRAALARLRGVAVPAVLVLYAVVMLPVLWRGQLPDWLVGLVPVAGRAPGGVSLAAFVAMTAVLCAALWLAGPGRRRRT